MIARGLTIAIACVGLATSAHAQDFNVPIAGGASESPLAMLDGSPGAPPGARFGSVWTRWLGMSVLETRALAATASVRRLVLAAGMSSTGVPDIGWNAAGCAIGWDGGGGGASARAVVRRDIDPGVAALGGEAGGSAWVTARGVMVWARAPQIWTRGEGPPLVRPLALGMRWGGDDSWLWLERSAPARDDDMNGRHRLGAAFAVRSAHAWVEARDGPLRAGVGLAAHARHVGVAARVDAHPELGETVSVALTLGAKRRSLDAATRADAGGRTP